MSSNQFDLQKSVTEVELAEAIRGMAPEDADVVRRLAFQRDCWRDAIRESLKWLRMGCFVTAEMRLEKLLGE